MKEKATGLDGILEIVELSDWFVELGKQWVIGVEYFE